MEEDLDTLYEMKRNLENKIENFFGDGQIYNGDRNYQILLEILQKVNEKIETISNTKLHWICKGCGKDCSIDNKDYYMVTNEIWDKYGVGEGMLCMDCMEERIEHKLTKDDILPCPLTQIFNSYTKEILNK